MLNRIRDYPPRKIIAFAGMVSLVFFVIWYTICRVIFRFANVDPNFWAALEGLSGAATLATVIGGGLMALAQLVESIDNREAQIAAHNLAAYNSIFDKMMTDRNIEARRWIYMNLSPDPRLGLESLSDEGRSHVKLVLNSFDQLGFLLQQDLISSDAIIEWVSPFVVKVWSLLGPYVEYEAARRNEPDYYESARYLAERCIEQRQSEGYDTTITQVDHAL
ncbi:MAG: hypothetical protein JXJ17_18865 [Anaerolineae bacterium]|nr:hypothetical protein [Anaerolineae bacterium]